MRILVGATAAGHKGAEAETWLRHAEAMRAASGHEVDFFLAAEMQPDGREPRLAAAEARVRTLGGAVWRYMIDDGAARIDGGNRLLRICEGRNLVIEHAMRSGAQWLLFADTDLELPPDLLPRLLEMDHPFTGVSVPAYVLSGPPVPGYPFPVQAYMNTAGLWFMQRRLFKRFRWLWDPDDGLTDDPATYRLIRELLQVEQHNRLDVVARHPPLARFEHRGADVNVRRDPLADHPVVAVVPAVFDQPADLPAVQHVLQALLHEGCARVLLLDGGGPLAAQARAPIAVLADGQAGRLQCLLAEGASLHRLWNLGWRAALQDFGPQVLVAFVDRCARFHPGLIDTLARGLLAADAWAAHPDPQARLADGPRLTGRTRATLGSKRHGGLSGHCFVLRAAAHTVDGLAMFDEGFTCWYGDDDLALRIEAAGWPQVAVEGLPCEVGAPGPLAERAGWAAQREADRKRFVARWGER